MKITIIAVGKIKEKFFADAILEYKKRLSKYADVKIVEVKDEKTKENASEHEKEIIKDTEGLRIIEHIPSSNYVVAMDIKGALYSSTELANTIKEKTGNSISHFTFIIGGSLGLSKLVLEKADLKMSFGKITLPHQLFRVVLLEQIYRSFRINTNAPYHK